MKKIIFIVIIIHLLPILGIFMEDNNGNDKWYKYIYILGVYIIGLFYFIFKYNKFLENSI